jgi:hypothetical protein
MAEVMEEEMCVLLEEEEEEARRIQSTNMVPGKLCSRAIYATHFALNCWATIDVFVHRRGL